MIDPVLSLDEDDLELLTMTEERYAKLRTLFPEFIRMRSGRLPVRPQPKPFQRSQFKPVVCAVSGLVIAQRDLRFRWREQYVMVSGLLQREANWLRQQRDCCLQKLVPLTKITDLYQLRDFYLRVLLQCPQKIEELYEPLEVALQEEAQAVEPSTRVLRLLADIHFAEVAMKHVAEVIEMLGGEKILEALGLYEEEAE